MVDWETLDIFWVDVAEFENEIRGEEAAIFEKECSDIVVGAAVLFSLGMSKIGCFGLGELRQHMLLDQHVHTTAVVDFILSNFADMFISIQNELLNEDVFWYVLNYGFLDFSNKLILAQIENV
jgi:hypothetical protein